MPPALVQPPPHNLHVPLVPSATPTVSATSTPYADESVKLLPPRPGSTLSWIKFAILDRPSDIHLAALVNNELSMNRVVEQAASRFGPNRLAACSTKLSLLRRFMAPACVQSWRSKLPMNLPAERDIQLALESTGFQADSFPSTFQPQAANPERLERTPSLTFGSGVRGAIGTGSGPHTSVSKKSCIFSTTATSAIPPHFKIGVSGPPLNKPPLSG